jgi:hypothetical protein
MQSGSGGSEYGAIAIPHTSMKPDISYSLKFYVDMPTSTARATLYDGNNFLITPWTAITNGVNNLTISSSVDHAWVAFYVVSSNWTQLYGTLTGGILGSLTTYPGVTIERVDGTPFPLLDPDVAPTFVWYTSSTVNVEVISPIPDSRDTPLKAEFVFRVYSESPVVDISKVNAWIETPHTTAIILSGEFVNEWTGEVITVVENREYIFAVIRPVGNAEYESGVKIHFTSEYEEL